MADDNDASLVFVGGKAVEQHIASDSNVEPEVRDEAKEAVRKAIAEAAEKEGEEAGKTAKRAAKQNPFKPEGAKGDSEEESEEGAEGHSEDDEAAEDDGAKPKKPKADTERGPDGRFLSKVKGKAEKDGAADKNGQEGKHGEPDSEADDSEEQDGDEEEETPANHVKEILNARKRAANITKKAQESAQQIQAEQQRLQEERQRFQAEQQQYQQAMFNLQQQTQQLQQQREALSRLISDPGRAVRELGMDPEQFVLQLAEDGTPEGRARRQSMELQQQLKDIQDFQRRQVEAAQKYQEELRQQQIQQQRMASVNKFLELAYTDKYPHVSMMFKGNERGLVALGDITADTYRNITGGREANIEDILDYLEDDIASKIRSSYNGNVAQEGAGSQKQSVKRPKGKSTLNPTASGERRSEGQSPLKDLDEEERHLAAQAAVRAALNASRN